MHYRKETDMMCLSVGELCALACRGGDLDSRYPRRGIPREDSVKDQGENEPLREGDACTHVMLRHVCRMGDVPLSVSGYADGVSRDGEGRYTVETVKRVEHPRRITRNLSEAEMAELCCYGNFLCASRGLSEVTLRVSYVSAEGEVAAERTFPMTAEELREAFYALMTKAYPRARDAYRRETEVRGISRRAVFPYREMRQAQEDMIRELLQDMRHRETVFAQAPTGIGKTISTLYPAIRAWGEDRCDKIFYLTAKASTRREAVSALERMIAAGTPIRGVVLSARESMCACKAAREGGGRLSRFCNPISCPYARGYYDRVEGAIQGLLDSGEGVFTYQRIKTAAEAGGVCPYELALDLSERCEVVVCDYNYVFSPTVYLRRYFAEGLPHAQGHRYIFLVDEAHNLADRATDAFSGRLSLTDIKIAQDALHDYAEAVTAEAASRVFPLEDGEGDDPCGGLTDRDLDDLIGELGRMAELCRHSMTRDADGANCGVELTRQLPDVLSACAVDLYRRCLAWQRSHADHPMEPVVESLVSALSGYTVAADHYGKGFVTLVEVEDDEVRVGLTCIDPSRLLTPRLKWAESAVLFSATLTPADYFADILGGDKNSVCVTFDSPFPPENLCVAVGSGVSTRYGDREKSYRAVVAYIAATVSARRGNYMVFFPSYEYMSRVQAVFEKKYPQVRLLVQKSHMTPEEREAFISAFSQRTDKLQIGFCVLGGSFSEGLDLPGESLIGAIVVGVGIPGLSSQRNVVKEHFDEKRDGEGYAYAYTYPGMNHVLQAAGRVIRRHEDKGVVVLLDDRYISPPYPQMFPEHWGNPRIAPDPLSLRDILGEFWQKKQE